MSTLSRLLPCWVWLRHYQRRDWAADAVAAAIVTVMLIPQSLAYALLAGLPPQAGLYASILPLLAYAVLGSSRTLSVGPMAVTSLLTLAAVAEARQRLGMEPAQTALVLAALSGAFLLLLGWLRFGFIASLLSQPVLAGFNNASVFLIALPQLWVVLGWPSNGQQGLGMLMDLFRQPQPIHGLTALIGVAAWLLLWGSRRYLNRVLQAVGVSAYWADLTVKLVPMLAVLLGIVCSSQGRFAEQGVAVVGAIPAGLPHLAWPPLSWAAIQVLWLPALLLSLIAYVSSVSVGQILAARRRQSLNPNQELIALGGANLAAAFSGGFPVTSGFSRSAVNFDAGAQTQMSGVLTAIGIMLASVWLTPWLSQLPRAILAATIIVAVVAMFDWGVFGRMWRYQRQEFAVLCLTFAATLLWRVDMGLLVGVAASLLLLLSRMARPHIAEIGQLPGSESFRNVQRHAVHTEAAILSLRVDDSLLFFNSGYFVTEVLRRTEARPGVKHVVLQCHAVNAVDFTAVERLQELNRILQARGIGLHLSEVKGPVADRLQQTELWAALSGHVFLTHYAAVSALSSPLECPPGQV